MRPMPNYDMIRNPQGYPMQPPEDFYNASSDNFLRSTSAAGGMPPMQRNYQAHQKIEGANNRGSVLSSDMFESEDDEDYDEKEDIKKNQKRYHSDEKWSAQLSLSVSQSEINDLNLDILKNFEYSDDNSSIKGNWRRQDNTLLGQSPLKGGQLLRSKRKPQ